jgi:hypothetical protein
MKMPSRKLLVLLTLAWVAPLWAAQEPVRAGHFHKSTKAECPYARAEAAARVRQSHARPVVTFQGSPAEGSFFDMGRSAALAP